MTTLHAVGDKVVAFTKGALEGLLPLCSHWRADGAAIGLSGGDALVDLASTSTGTIPGSG